MKQPEYYRWYVVVTLMVGYFFSFLDRTMIGLMVEPIQADLLINDTQMSLLMGLAFVLLYSIAGIPLGFLADRINRVRLISIGAVIWCCMTAVCGLANSYWQLFLARIAIGLGEATLAPAANSLIGDYFKSSEVGKALSIFNLGLAAGAGLSLVLGGQAITYVASLGEISLPLIGSREPWQVVFISFGLGGLIFLLMLFFVREPDRSGRATKDKPFNVEQIVTFFGLHRKLYVCLFFSQAALTVITFAALSWMPSFFIRIHGWTAAEAGMSYGATSLTAAVLGMIASGFLMDKLQKKGKIDSAWWVMTLGVAVFLPALVIAPLFDSAHLTLALVMIGIFGAALSAIAAPTAALLASPNEVRGMAAAIYYLVINLFGAAIGPTAVALLNDYVFFDKAAVGKSIAIVGFLSWVVAVGLLYYGASAFRDRLRDSTKSIDGAADSCADGPVAQTTLIGTPE